MLDLRVELMFNVRLRSKGLSASFIGRVQIRDNIIATAMTCLHHNVLLGSI